MSKRFAFGRNWNSFVRKHLSEERINLAKDSLRTMLGLESLEGKSFLDIGCGSGLFSLAARRLGAANVVSFDIDEGSVACCERLRTQDGNTDGWAVKQGSILDEAMCASLGTFDIVYSWGVLHHTGNMWKAIENACNLVRKDGLLFIALYNRADGLAIHPDGRPGSSRFWLVEKKWYSSLPWSMQNLVDYFVMAVMICLYLARLKNPLAVISSHKKNFRGMSWRIDIKDWLGGYPYECARADEVFSFCRKQGFVLENLRCNNGLLNNEYVFRKE